jgi:hypothetical protein
VGTEGPAGGELRGLEGAGDDAAKSLSVSMGPIGWSAMTDMAERRRNSSGGRFRGCEFRSYLCADDREKGFVGEEFFERIPVLVDLGRLSRSLSREREDVEAFFSGDCGGAERGSGCSGGSFLSGWSVGGFFAVLFLKMFICSVLV